MCTYEITSHHFSEKSLVNLKCIMLNLFENGIIYQMKE